MKYKNESPSLMEPMSVSSEKQRGDIMELVVELTSLSQRLESQLPVTVKRSLAELVRSMNCYYSNLIEGHDTHPVDIERALNGDFSGNQKRRDLQLEAKAHIEVQGWIDDGGLAGRVYTTDGLKQIHKRFCDLLPADLLLTEPDQVGVRKVVVPGKFRKDDVQVGQHVAISPDQVDRFMMRFEEVYNGSRPAGVLFNAAAAHHRLLWIHPFLDGNGRVARLMSHAAVTEALGGSSIWSISRGLARNESRYKALLMGCDQQREGGYDGRGNLSEHSLASLTVFFLQTSIDQVNFMSQLMEPEKFKERVILMARGLFPNTQGQAKAEQIIKAALYSGEVERGEIPALIGVQDRQARRITQTLTDAGIITSDSQKRPLRLAFTANSAGELMPGLFPKKNL